MRRRRIRPGFLNTSKGPRHDDFDAGALNINSFRGDDDDILGMTVRSSGRAFRGRFVTGGTSTVIESSLAEVWWYTTWSDIDGNVSTIIFNDESAELRRRALLIRPDLGLLLDDVNVAAVQDFFRNNDISARVVAGSAGGLYDVIANDLTDLAVRSNRFCHDPTLGSYSLNTTVFPSGFPYVIDRLFLASRAAYKWWGYPAYRSHWF